MFTSLILLLSLCGLCAGYEAYHDTQSCGENRGEFMDDNTRYKILYYHEGTRNVLALGESPGYASGFLPPAKNLFKIRWNCTLEEKARELTKSCAHSRVQLPNFGKNVYNDTVPEAVTGNPSEIRMRKYNFISAAIDDWLMPSDQYPIEDDVSYNESLYSDSNLYTFANMAYDKIYEVGCNYEECQRKDEIEASLICIYNTIVPDHARLYEVGSKDPDTAGCNKDSTVCQHLRKANATCDDLLCKLPNVVSSFL